MWEIRDINRQFCQYVRVNRYCQFCFTLNSRINLPNYVGLWAVNLSYQESVTKPLVPGYEFSNVIEPIEVNETVGMVFFIPVDNFIRPTKWMGFIQAARFTDDLP